MAPLDEVTLGISLGVLFGVVPAIGAAMLGAASEYWPEYGVSRALATAVALLATALLAAGVGVVELATAQAPRLLGGALAAALLALYGYSRGATLAADLPRDVRLPVERGRPLSAAAVDGVDAVGQVTIRPSGEIGTVDGYPPVSNDLAEHLSARRWRLPVDLPLGELEARIESRLRTEYDLAAVSASVDPRGRVTVAAAPPSAGVAGRVPDGCRAVSVSSRVPDELQPGDEVLLDAGAVAVNATVLGTSAGPGAGPGVTDEATEDRVTVAVPTENADDVLHAADVRIAVRSRETRADFRALALLERAGQSVRVETLDATDAESLRSADDVDVFASRPPAGGSSDDRDGWSFDPSLEDLDAGWDVVLVGEPVAIERLLGPASTARTEEVDA